MTDLLQKLAEFESPNVFNPWRDADPLDNSEHSIMRRRNRLAAHFDCRPRFLLIGEAPGYQGCRYSGVPFTSERLIAEGKLPRIAATRFTTREKPWSEPSATIVWGALHQLGIAEETVLWNAFAWHPHKPGEPLSNRTPTFAEMQAGIEVFASVLNHFGGARVVAVGENASRLLNAIGVWNAKKVRHPANGGATKFREQLAEIVNSTKGSAR